MKVEEDEAPFAVNMETSCVGAKVDFKIQENTKNDSYLWNFGDGSFSTEQILLTNMKCLEYMMTLSVRSQGKVALQRTQLKI